MGKDERLLAIRSGSILVLMKPILAPIWSVAVMMAGTVGIMAADDVLGVKVLHVFSRADGKGFNAQGSLALGTDGMLYGTTSNGGAHSHRNALGHGTVYRIKSDGSGFTVIHHFQDAANPAAGVTEGRDGFLYCTTESGGRHLNGTVVRMGKDGSGFSILRHFTGVSGDGSRPLSTLSRDGDGVLYGTTSGGGAHFMGTVFKLRADGSDYRLIYNFIGKQRMDGAEPRGGLLLGSDGVLYGTTSVGGKHNKGTVYAINRDGSGYRLLWMFGDQVADGASPHAGLTEDRAGRLYGTTVSGGSAGQGTVFSVAKNGREYRILRSFSGLSGDGRNPQAQLIEGKNELLYGVALNGGSEASGVIFRMGKDGKNFASLYSFTARGAVGRWPQGIIVTGESGLLFGTTSAGGSGGQGAIFRLDPGNP